MKELPLNVSDECIADEKKAEEEYQTKKSVRLKKQDINNYPDSL